MIGVKSASAVVVLSLFACAGSAHAAIVTRPVIGFTGTGDSINVDLGFGPVPTGPITISLQNGPMSREVFDTTAGTVEFDLYLQVDFPLLGAIMSPPPTLRIQEIGPITWGISQGNGDLAGWGATSGGGVVDAGTPFAGGIFFNGNNWEYKSTTNENAAAPSPPTPYPVAFNPFPPAGLPAARTLAAGFDPASQMQVDNLLPLDGAQTGLWNFDGIFRFPGQVGDLNFLGSGTWTSVPAPTSAGVLSLLIVGALLRRR